MGRSFALAVLRSLAVIDCESSVGPNPAPPRFLAIGHVTRDLLADGEMAGGAAFYAARTAASLGLRAAVVTSLGSDFTHQSELEGLELAIRPAPQTTCFENRYGPSGRVQRLKALAAPLAAADLPEPLRGAECVYVCPVMGEVEADIARDLGASVCALGAQGWLRETDDRGRVRSRRWRPRAQQLQSVQLIVLSDEDAAHDPKLVPYLAARVPIVAFTHGAKGCELFVASEHYRVPAYPTEQLGPTGAGDAFGAAMLCCLHAGLVPLAAAYVASCAASIVVEAPGGDALSRIPETWGRLASYGRTHGVDVPLEPVAWSG